VGLSVEIKGKIEKVEITPLSPKTKIFRITLYGSVNVDEAEKLIELFHKKLPIEVLEHTDDYGNQIKMKF
jgi:hypothetical protein